MIDLIFYRDSEIIFIRIKGHDITFSNSIYGAVYSTIDNIKLNYDGVIKEHPDLKNKEDWNKEAVKRFKEKIKTYRTEDEISDYIIYELRSIGYTPKYRQKQGHRREKI